MAFVKKLFNFYINSSIHVAISVVSLTYITLLQYNIQMNIAMLMFVFFSSITGYNFVKYFGVAKFHHRSLTNGLKAIQVFSFFCFLFLCYYALQLQTKTLLYVFGFAVVTFLYAVPLVPKRLFLDSKHSLRSISGLKIYLIALVWCGVTVFLPLIENDFPIKNDVVVTAFQRFLLVIVLILPFEIRDLRYDSLKLATIPQRIGIKHTKIMGSLLLMMFFFLEFFKVETSYADVCVLLVITIITLLFLVFSNIGRGKYYSAFWVEGLPILWLFFCLFIVE